MGISAVVLTKNEEENIKACLKSLGFCEEIVVVDDSSTDKTRAIAKQLGAKVYQRDMNMNYSSQSNFGMAKANCLWVLFIDADERISGSLKQEIKLAIKNRQIKGYFLKRIDCVWGKWLKYGEIGSFKSLRLARKNSGKWKRRVHPYFDIKGKTKTLKNPIFHYSHPEIRETLTKINRWSSWHALANQEEGKSSSVSKIIFKPIMKFIFNFVFKKGFLDGIHGFLFALVMSFHSYLSWSKLWLIQKRR